MTCHGVSVGVIVRNGDLGLFIQRKLGPMAGKWAFPAGHRELGESTQETAARELAEEVSIAVDINRFHNLRWGGRLVDECRHGITRHAWFIWEVQVADLFAVRSLEETLCMRWVPRAEWHELDLEPVWRHILTEAGYLR